MPVWVLLILTTSHTIAGVGSAPSSRIITGSSIGYLSGRWGNQAVAGHGPTITPNLAVRDTHVTAFASSSHMDIIPLFTACFGKRAHAIWRSNAIWHPMKVAITGDVTPSRRHAFVNIASWERGKGVLAYLSRGGSLLLPPSALDRLWVEVMEGVKAFPRCRHVGVVPIPPTILFFLMAVPRKLNPETHISYGSSKQTSWIWVVVRHVPSG